MRPLLLAIALLLPHSAARSVEPFDCGDYPPADPSVLDECEDTP